MRLRFWLAAMDVAHALHVASGRRLIGLYLWTVGKASDAVQWEIEARTEEAPR
jgi:hypothetical protein